jgi:hypothetical protein
MSVSDADKNNTIDSRWFYGGACIPNPAKIKTLFARTTSGGTAIYATSREYGSGAGYQVPTDKKFVILSVWIQSVAGAAGDIFGISSSTNDVGFASASKPTGWDYDTASDGGNVKVSAAANEQFIGGVDYIIPAEKFVSIYGNGGAPSYYTIIGIEVDEDATTL